LRLPEVIAAQNPITHGDAAPDLVAITNAITEAKPKIDALKLDQSSKRQSDDEVANLLASLLTDLSSTVNGLTSSPLIVALLPGLDLALSNLLKSVEVLLANVLKLVAVL
jgi:hypothetical protein